MIRQAVLRAKPRMGQSVFQTMLIISCVALALGIFFAVFEYYDLYRGEIRLHKFVRAEISPVADRQPAPAPAAAEETAASPDESEAPPPAEAGEGPAPAEAATEEPEAADEPGTAGEGEETGVEEG